MTARCTTPRLTLEPILLGREYGADAANYSHGRRSPRGGGHGGGARVRDLMDKDREYDISAAVTVNAAGPW